jgi:nitrate reductase gamma subunit
MILPVLIYIAVFAFLVGIIGRIARIAAMPTHVRWELYPIPDGAAGKIRTMLAEIFLLEGVRKHHRALWIWSWIFHLSLYLLIAVAALSLAASFSLRAKEAIAPLLSAASPAAFALGIAGTGGLAVRRLTSAKLRYISSPADLFNLVLLFALFLAGFIYVLIDRASAIVMIDQAGSLVGRSQAPILHPLAYLHLCLMALFIAYMPFTHMAHMVLKYFTYHSVRWDDKSIQEIPQRSDRLAGYLNYPVNWAAPHIQRGKTGEHWADVVSTPSKERKIERN